MKRPPAAILVLLVSAAAFGLFWWYGLRDTASAELVLYGNIDIRQIALAFEGSGRVAEVHAEEGDHIEAGTTLARLDTRTLELQAEQAKAQSEVQRQTLLRLQNGSRPEEIAQAKSRLAAGEADLFRAERDLVRLQEIFAATEGRGVSIAEVERAENNLKVAKAKSHELQEALRLAQLGPREEEIAGAKAQLQASEATLKLLQHQIEQGLLKAPTKAVVRSRLLEPGDMATPQRPVFALALTDPKWVRAYVNEPNLGRIRTDMPAVITTDSSPETIPGKVGYISSVAEFTPKTVQTEELRTHLVYEVRIIVADEGNRLRLGQPVSVRLDTGSQ